MIRIRPAMAEKTMHCKILENNLLMIEFEHEAKRNSLEMKTVKELAELVAKLNQDLGSGSGSYAQIRCFAFFAKAVGAQKTSMSGGDLKEMASFASQAQATSYCNDVKAVLDGIETLPIPSVFFTNGKVIGGGVEFSAAFDLRLCDPVASFCLKQLHIGLTTGWGGSFRLKSLIGTSKLKQMLFFGKPLSAAEAERLGYALIVPINPTNPEESISQASKPLLKLEGKAVQHQKSLLKVDHREESFLAETRLFASLWRNPTHSNVLKRFS